MPVNDGAELCYAEVLLSCFLHMPRSTLWSLQPSGSVAGCLLDDKTMSHIFLFLVFTAEPSTLYISGHVLVNSSKAEEE